MLEKPQQSLCCLLFIIHWLDTYPNAIGLGVTPFSIKGRQLLKSIRNFVLVQRLLKVNTED